MGGKFQKTGGDDLVRGSTEKLYTVTTKPRTGVWPDLWTWSLFNYNNSKDNERLALNC